MPVTLLCSPSWAIPNRCLSAELLYHLSEWNVPTACAGAGRLLSILDSQCELNCRVSLNPRPKFRQLRPALRRAYLMKLKPPRHTDQHAVGERRVVAHPTISPRMLALELRKLEKAGVVRRTAYAGYPSRVEYALTPTGSKLLPIIDALGDWWSETQSERAALQSGFSQP